MHEYGIGPSRGAPELLISGATHSILWAIIDGILGWLYVIYFALFRS
jgi:hypothetical protein